VAPSLGGLRHGIVRDLFDSRYFVGRARFKPLIDARVEPVG